MVPLGEINQSLFRHMFTYISWLFISLVNFSHVPIRSLGTEFDPVKVPCREMVPFPLHFYDRSRASLIDSFHVEKVPLFFLQGSRKVLTHVHELSFSLCLSLNTVGYGSIHC